MNGPENMVQMIQPETIFAPGMPYGFMLDPMLPRDYFVYVAEFATLVVNVPQTVNLNIDAASDFYWTSLQVYTVGDDGSTPTAQTEILPNAVVLLTDSGSQRQLMSAPVTIATIAGSGQRPHPLVHPRLFKANSNIVVQVTSIDADQGYDYLRLSFEGFKVYGATGR